MNKSNFYFQNNRIEGKVFDSIPYPTIPIKKAILLDDKRTFPKEYNLLKKYKNNMYPVFRQYVCGSCWAWSVASLLSDRYVVKYNKKNPLFSPTPIISGIYCKMKNSPNIDLYNACEGGSAFDALVLLSEITNSKTEIFCNNSEDLRYILKPIGCDNYDWCELNPYCNSTLNNSNNEVLDHLKKDKNLNTIVPEFTTECQQHKPSDDYNITISTKFNNKSNKKLRLKLSKAYILEKIEQIQYSIYSKGPVINNFVIFPDFIHKPKNDSMYWKETDNVYIHKKGIHIYDLGENNDVDNDVLLGYHSTTVLGWGVQKFNKKRLYNILNIPVKNGEENDTVEISYWICRNIWGKDWNGDGYFKLAFTNKELQINTQLGADIPVKLQVNECYMPCGTECDKGDTCTRTEFGGCCAIDILDENEIDLTDTDIVRNSFMNNRIVSKHIKNNSIPVSFNKLPDYVILDLNHKKHLSDRKKTIIKVILYGLIIVLLSRKKLDVFTDCKQMVYLVLLLMSIILTNKL